MGLPTYATREQFMVATDTHTTAYLSAAVDRVLQTASRNIERKYGRHFYPLTEAVTWTFTGGGSGFWMNRDLLSLTSATVDDVSQTVADVELYPSHYGPPYSFIGLMGASVVVTGVWGYSNDTESVGTITANIGSASTTSATCSDSSKVGVGDLITINSERMVVTEKAIADISVDLAADLTAVASDDQVTVDGAGALAGEVITIDTERMLVLDVVSSTVLNVIRAYDGTALATHDGTSTPADIYAPRTLTIDRGAAGSTAATHTSGDSITRNAPPAPITSLCLAEAEVMLAQERAGYARTVGTGEGEREVGGKGLADARREASTYKRRRLAAV